MPRKILALLAVLGLAGLMIGSAYAQERSRQGRSRQGRQRREVVRPKDGEVLKDFSLKDAKGNVVKLSDFRNKKIFVLELGACT